MTTTQITATKHDLQRVNYYKTAFNLKQRSSSKEFACALSIAEQTLRQSRSTGYLLGVPAPKHVKLGRLVQYRIEDIIDWIENNDSTYRDEVA